MKKEFELLQEEIDRSISEWTTGEAVIDRFARIIEMIREKIGFLKLIAEKGFADREEEVGFFKEVWPYFFGKLFYLNCVQKYEMEKQFIPHPSQNALHRLAEDRISRFYRENREFCFHYLSGSKAFDELFTQERNLIHSIDELILLIDPINVAVGSYRAAWCLAYIDYKEYLENERKQLQNAGADNRPKLKWKEGKTAAVELIKAQVEAGSIEIDGKPASAAQLKADFEERYGEDLEDFGHLMYQMDARKTADTPYLTKLVRAYLKRKTRLRK